MNPGFAKAGLPAETIHLVAVNWDEDSGMPGYMRVIPRRVEDESESKQKPSVRVRLGDLFPLLALAHRGNYLWLHDFEDDEICITPDLYELLMTFRAYRPSA